MANPNAVRAFVSRLYEYARPHRIKIVLIVFGVFLDGLFNAAVPLSFKLLIDRSLLGGDQHLLKIVLIGLGLGVITISISGFGRDYLYAGVVTRMLGELRDRMFVHLQRLSIEFYARSRAGEVLSCFSTDLTSVENALTNAVPWAVLPALDVLISTYVLFSLNWHLALVAMLVWPASLIGPRIIASRASKAGYERKLEEAKTVSIVQESIAVQPVVKAFGLETKPVHASFLERNSALISSSIRLSFFSALLERSATIGILVLQVVILGVGTLMAYHHQISIGSLTAFLSLFLNLSYSLTYVAQYVPTFIQASGAMQHIDDLMHEAPRVLDKPHAPELPRLKKEISFQNVNFSYTGEELNIKNVTLCIPKGASVAFVGSSGSGKSTMVNLLMRFYDPNVGKVLIDGLDLREAPLSSLHDQIGIVFQDSLLFNTTVRDNIRMGKQDATDEEVESAAKVAEIHDIIMSWSQGYNTLVGERGGQLSGGQRQRIAIARAILRDPEILVLDEATSALDPGTEASINATLAKIGHGRTVVSVTHRLASVVNNDFIFVFDKGSLVEQGNHQKLLEANGSYSQLWKKQTGFALSDDGDHAKIDAAKLKHLPILNKLPPELQTEVAQLFVTEQHAKDHLVFAEGDHGDRFYLIVRGKVAAFKTLPSGEEQQLGMLEDGDYFGEIALIKNQPRSASIRTLLPSVFLTLPQEQFVNLLNRVPALKAEILATIKSRDSK